MGKTRYAVVVVHGIGAGTGKEREGFSETLRKNVQNELHDGFSLCWKEADWEGENDNVDRTIRRVIVDVCNGYLSDVGKQAEIVSEPWPGEQSKCGILRIVLRWVRCLIAIAIRLKKFALEEIKDYAPGIVDAVVDLPLYLDDKHGDKIRERVRTAIAEAMSCDGVEGVVLVGHSLGSVIAYDVVIEEQKRGNKKNIVALVTMGSPLGWVSEIRNVENGAAERTPQLPVNGILWRNFWDEADPVPERKPLDEEMLPGVKNDMVTSGLKLISAHCAYWKDGGIAKTIAELCQR